MESVRRRAALKGARWRHATKRTAETLKAVWAIEPKLTIEEKTQLIEQARALTFNMLTRTGKPVDDGKYWGIFINTLRIFVASFAREMPSDLFVEGEEDYD